MATAALIPDAATYGTQQAYATQAYQKAKSNIQNQQLGWLKQYGMTGDYNQNTNSVDNMHVDPYNQYGLIQQNRNSEAQDLQSAQDNAIGRGIGGSGLGNQMASNMRFQHGVQDTNLGNQFVSGMGQFSQGLSDASNTYQQALFQAENDAITRALQNQQFEQYSNGDNADTTDATAPYQMGFTGQGQGESVDPDAYAAWAAKQTKATQAAIIKHQVLAQKPTVTQTRKKVAAKIASGGASKAKMA